MKKLSPILWTKDLDATIWFYETVLGFKGVGNFPGFVSLTRDEVELMFIVPQDDRTACDTGDETGFFRKPVLTGSIFITTDHVDELWEAVKDVAVIKTTIANRAYKMRDFSILDNNGYELVFGKDISNEI
ncbi:bleomycin resistance family protein [Panacibacter sp. DH6]|uniref:Bleomycin resistance family protein n=1 Tax=Panacibacter microcysteis TaxID=2793269 RepID=A0A931EAN6_9BACT|nr:VOC family protein [Panacibacter microcysteis]MBG9377379.1 bleomycin resistance family protein [Panacibacter microcysteis]